ncbi:alcohol dehydrogenase catalytic domain-containing protein [Thermodesulfobacteriota bacterium]
MLPDTMMAVRFFEYGDPPVLQYIEVPMPQIEPDEVLVRVHATSVNNWDLNYRKGLLTPPPGRPPLPLPFQLGRELAGEVVAVGNDVEGFRSGDRVVAMTCPACGLCEYCMRGLDNLCINTVLPGHQRFGGYAEYVAVKGINLIPGQSSLSFEKQACCIWSYGTVWHMAVNRGKLQAGQDVLITGASSGMGTAAVQIARLGGARRVFGTTGSENKIQRLKEAGVDHVLNYREENVPERVKSMTGGLGVDLALDNIGGEMFSMAMECLRMDGTLVSAAKHGGRYANLDILMLYRNHLNLLGSRASTRKEQSLVLALAGQGLLDPVIDRVLPLSEAAEAHRIMERQEHFGKIVLVP